MMRDVGVHRYLLAAIMSQENFPNGADVAIVVCTKTLPNEFTASPFGVVGPVLLTLPNEVPPETATEIRRLNVKEVIIVGDFDQVSAEVEAQLKALVL
jgi:putative cell wall-binding protein